MPEMFSDERINLETYIYIHTNIYIYIYIYIYIQRQKLLGKKLAVKFIPHDHTCTHKKSPRHTHTHTHRGKISVSEIQNAHTHTHTHKQTNISNIEKAVQQTKVNTLYEKETFI